MLKARESLVGKLLLSSALVAVSLGYGVWQRHPAAAPAVAMAPAPMPSAAKEPLPAPPGETSPAPVAPVVPDKPDSADDTGMVAKEAAPSPKPSIIAKAAPETDTPAAAPPLQEAALPPAIYAPPPTRMVSDDVSPPIALATGTPAPGVMPPIPPGAGTHLLDGDYVSDRHQLEWGDLKVKISVHGGQITGVQILQYPDHRSRSLDLSLMAGPILESEVIKTQQAQVDAVSSATDTSYAFQDTIANVIVKAARE